MIKAAAITISILLLIAAGSSLLAQPSTQDIASAEAIRRQANIIELRRTLDDAARVQKQGDLPGRPGSTSALWTSSAMSGSASSARARMRSLVCPRFGFNWPSKRAAWAT